MFQVSFELLVKRQIRRLEEPSLRCVELVHGEMQSIIQHCGVESQQEMLRFPKLHEKIIDVVTHLLRRRLPPTNTMVENLVQIELAYINTKHPDFHKDAAVVSSILKSAEEEEALKHGQIARPISNGEPLDEVRVSNGPGPVNADKKSLSWLNIRQQNAVRSDSAGFGKEESSSTNSPQLTPQHVQSPQKPINLLPEIPTNQTSRKLTDKEKRDCEVIERLIKSYFYIVRKAIQDSVPKAVMHFLVNHVRDNLQSELVTHLYKSEYAEELLNESEHIAQRRKEAADMLKALQKANLIISEIRETHMW